MSTSSTTRHLSSRTTLSSSRRSSGVVTPAPSPRTVDPTVDDPTVDEASAPGGSAARTSPGSGAEVMLRIDRSPFLQSEARLLHPSLDDCREDLAV